MRKQRSGSGGDGARKHVGERGSVRPGGSWGAMSPRCPARASRDPSRRRVPSALKVDARSLSPWLSCVSGTVFAGLGSGCSVSVCPETAKGRRDCEMNGSGGDSRGLRRGPTFCRAPAPRLPPSLPEALLPAELCEVRAAFESWNFCFWVLFLFIHSGAVCAVSRPSPRRLSPAPFGLGVCFLEAGE